MKVVLGIDGLEYGLVEEFRLDSIKQDNYTKTDLSDFDIIVTPPIWASMLTGEIQEEMNEKFKEHKNNLNSFIFRLLRKVLTQKMRFYLTKNKIGKKLFSSPINETDHFLSRNNVETIFDVYPGQTWNNGIPGYNKSVRSKKKDKLRLKAIEGKTKKYEEYLFETLNKEKEELFNALENDNYDFIFWYTQFLDNSGHIFIDNKMKTMNHYMKIHEIIKDVKDYADELYIISDHGMKMEEIPEHSNHGFFSSSNGRSLDKPKELFDLLLDDR